MRPLDTVRDRALLGLPLLLLTLVADQASKQLALMTLFAEPVRIEVLPVFNLTPVWNRGVSFGLLATDDAAGPWLLGGFAVVVSVTLLVWMLRANSRWLVAGLGLIVGGAIGNAIDRARHGAVVDFLDFHWQGMHWPAFNIADTAITIGVVMLLIDAFLGRNES